MVRLDARLFLDSGFASGGKRVEPIVPSSNDSANSVAIAPDGRIVVAGTCQIDPENNPSRNGICLMRLTSGGALDPTLIGPSGLASGKFAIALGSVSDSASGVAVQPDGKIVVVGTCIDDTVAETVFCAARFTESGALDASFVGPNATAANGKFLFAISPAVGQNDFATALALQPDGRVVIVGRCQSGGQYDMCFARLNGNGTWDLSFVGPSNNANGRFLRGISVSGDLFDSAYAVQIQPDGKIVIAGECRGPTGSDFCLVRLNRDGTLDPQFAAPVGVEEGAFRIAVGTASSVANASVLTPDGKLIVVGQCRGGGSDNEFCAIRLHADGDFDRSFDGSDLVTPGNGSVSVRVTAGNDVARGVHITPRGNIFVAGYCGAASATDFCAVELEGGAFGGKRCSLDLNADAAIDATSDALIHLRVALGFSGERIVDGLVGLGQTWQEVWNPIRDRLWSQCGIQTY